LSFSALVLSWAARWSQQQLLWKCIQALQTHISWFLQIIHLEYHHRKGDTHKASHAILHLNSIDQRIFQRTVRRRVSQGRHSKVNHNMCVIISQCLQCWSYPSQNQWFSIRNANQTAYFQVLNLYGRYLESACIPKHWELEQRSHMLPFHLICSNKLKK